MAIQARTNDSIDYHLAVEVEKSGTIQDNFWKQYQHLLKKRNQGLWLKQQKQKRLVENWLEAKQTEEQSFTVHVLSLKC